MTKLMNNCPLASDWDDKPFPVVEHTLPLPTTLRA